MQVEVFRICKLHAPQLFWHHFPPLTDLQNFFIEITNSDNTQSAPPRVVKNRENKRKKRKIQAEIALDMQEDSEMVTNDANNDSMERLWEEEEKKAKRKAQKEKARLLCCTTGMLVVQHMLARLLAVDELVSWSHDTDTSGQERVLALDKWKIQEGWNIKDKGNGLLSPPDDTAEWIDGNSPWHNPIDLLYFVLTQDPLYDDIVEFTRDLDGLFMLVVNEPEMKPVHKLASSPWDVNNDILWSSLRRVNDKKYKSGWSWIISEIVLGKEIQDVLEVAGLWWKNSREKAAKALEKATAIEEVDDGAGDDDPGSDGTGNAGIGQKDAMQNSAPSDQQQQVETNNGQVEKTLDASSSETQARVSPSVTSIPSATPKQILAIKQFYEFNKHLSIKMYAAVMKPHFSSEHARSIK
ncbi:hypothetical protein BD769DRAFT_1680261 [Suillus cothurnatus]|nr:hypothetical protein BD769DRAFT_1680261 [Suillus cothurnatus]